jgi:hypothetical protein
MADATIPPQILQELQDWTNKRRTILSQYPSGGIPQDVADVFNGKTLSPEAYQFAHNYANGQPYYNADTGETSTAGGIWSNPETWVQLALGGALGGAAATGGYGLASAGGAAGSGGAGGGAAAGTTAAGSGGAATAAKVASAASGLAGKAASPSHGQEALALLAGIVPGLIARTQSNNNVPPELSQLLNQSMARQQYQDPLFQATTRQAFQGLPTYAQQGLSLPSAIGSPAGASGTASGTPASQSGSGGGMNPLLAGGIGAAAALSPQIIAGLKRLFSGGAAASGGGGDWSE